MRRALLLTASLALTACQRRESAATAPPAPAEAPPSRISGPMPAPAANLPDKPVLLEKAAAYGRENPVAGLKWLFEQGAISGQNPMLDAYLGEALKSDPRRTLDLADLVESAEPRQAYQSAAYEQIAARNPNLAWQLWGQRHATHDDESPLSILRHETKAAGLRQAWGHLLAQDPGASVMESGVCSLFTEGTLPGADAGFALTLLRQVPEAQLPKLEPGMIDILVGSDPDGFGAWISSFPANPMLDAACAAMARREAARHDFTNSRTWLNRIHDPATREETTAYEHDEMSSTPVAVSPPHR